MPGPDQTIDRDEVTDFLTEKLISNMLSGGEGSLLALRAAGMSALECEQSMQDYLKSLYSEMTGEDLKLGWGIENGIKIIVKSGLELINEKLAAHLQKLSVEYSQYLMEIEKFDDFNKRYASALARHNQEKINFFTEKFTKSTETKPLSETLVEMLKSNSHGLALPNTLIEMMHGDSVLAGIAREVLERGKVEISDLPTLLGNKKFCKKLNSSWEPSYVSSMIQKNMQENKLFLGNMSITDKELVQLIKGNDALREIANRIVDMNQSGILPYQLHMIVNNAAFQKEIAKQKATLKAKVRVMEQVEPSSSLLYSKTIEVMDEIASFFNISKAYFFRSELETRIKSVVDNSITSKILTTSNQSEIASFVVKGRLSRTLSGKRAVIPVEEVGVTAKKESGFSSGYISVSKAGEMFMVKRAVRALPVGNEAESGYKQVEVKGLVREVLFAPFYYLSMGGKLAPKIATVSLDKTDKDYVSMTSEFLANFETMDDYLKDANDYATKQSKLVDVVNKEVYFAAVLAGAEEDLNLGNLGIVKIMRDGKEINSFAKIDHGNSGINFFTDANKMFQQMVTNYRKIAEVSTYKTQTETGLFTLDLNKLIDAIDKDILLMQIKMETFIDGGIALLNSGKEKLDVRGVLFDGMESAGDLEAVRQHFQSKFKTHIAQLEQYSAILKSIRSVSKEADLEGKWLTDICLVKNFDIISHLKEKNAKIAGLDPIHFAIKNNIKVKTLDPMDYAITNGIPFDQFDLIGHVKDNAKALVKNLKMNQIEVLFVRMTEQDKAKNPLESSKLFNDAKKILDGAVRESLANQDIIVSLEEKGITILGLPPIHYAIKNHIKVKGLDPMDYAIRNDIPFDQFDLIGHVQDNAQALAQNLKMQQIAMLVKKMTEQDKIKNRFVASELFEKAKENLDDAVKRFIAEKINNGNKIEDENPLVYAIQNRYPLDKCNVISHVKDNAKELAKKLTKDEIKKVLDVMQKQSKREVSTSDSSKRSFVSKVAGTELLKADKALRDASQEAGKGRLSRGSSMGFGRGR